MPKRKYNVSPEARAKMSARMKALWQADREAMLAAARRGGLNRGATNPRKWPQRGTEEWRLFCKIANCTNADTAHAQFSRVRP